MSGRQALLAVHRVRASAKGGKDREAQQRAGGMEKEAPKNANAATGAVEPAALDDFSGARSGRPSLPALLFCFC